MIYKYPNKILLTPSTDVTLEEGKEIETLLRGEIKQLQWGEVVGLAAPQIGINKNVFICLDKVYFNPKIIGYVGVPIIKEEGCYSLKEEKFDYKVKRYPEIQVQYNNITNGEIKKVFLREFKAQVFQHEYDHLLGKLCCQ